MLFSIGAMIFPVAQLQQRGGRVSPPLPLLSVCCWVRRPSEEAKDILRLRGDEAIPPHPSFLFLLCKRQVVASPRDAGCSGAPHRAGLLHCRGWQLLLSAESELEVHPPGQVFLLSSCCNCVTIQRISGHPMMSTGPIGALPRILNCTMTAM